MKNVIILLAGLFFFFVTSCTSEERAENPENWSDQQVSEWFEHKEWLGQTKLQPHASIDRKELALRYHEDKERWDKAFAFLNEKDLLSIEEGNYELDGGDVFAIVSEYNTKNPEDASYEAHEKYTDIQYIVSGSEQIGVADISSASVTTPYDEEQDIAFYSDVTDAGYHLAEPGTLFIFFPGMGHSPGRKVEDNTPVKKIVIKVKV